MKPVADGLLWRSAPQAFRYAFSQPVSIVVAGINNRELLEDDLRYANEFKPMSEEEMENIYTNSPELGTYVCRQCKKCMVCPENIPLTDIFLYEGYFDRQMADGIVTNASDYALKERLRFWFGNRDLAMNLYSKLEVKADNCTDCGKCTPECPYGIDVRRKLGIADYKLAQKDIFWHATNLHSFHPRWLMRAVLYERLVETQRRQEPSVERTSFLQLQRIVKL